MQGDQITYIPQPETLALEGSTGRGKRDRQNRIGAVVRWLQVATVQYGQVPGCSDYRLHEEVLGEEGGRSSHCPGTSSSWDLAKE